jgi:predicted RNA-binding protein YlxR (DUF448 family)
MEPVRTCIGCRRRSPRSSLLRVVARDGVAVVDARARMTGRGAWVHRTRECIEVATERRAWARAFRVAGSVDVTEVVAEIGSTGSDERTG